jgi:hypothetical protein
MWIVVTLHMDLIHGPTMEAFGPWPLADCERERRRRLADYALRNPHGQPRRFSVRVIPVVNETIAP